MMKKRSIQQRRRSLLVHLFVYYYVLTIFIESQNLALAFSLSSPPSKNNKQNNKSWFAELQKCYTPTSILENVGQYITPDQNDCCNLSSLVLVRLSKQLIILDNDKKDKTGQPQQPDLKEKDFHTLSHIIKSFEASKWDSNDPEAAVEGTKAACVITRLLTLNLQEHELWYQPLLEKWKQQNLIDSDYISSLEPHHLSGLKWAFDVWNQPLPNHLLGPYEDLQLPFRILPSFLCNTVDTDSSSSSSPSEFTVTNLVNQVDFKVDDIRTKSKQIVKERRQTAWQGDDHVGPFEYSGKSMNRDSWSPVVLTVRNLLKEKTGQYYDGSLINLYPDGGSGMRYHADPDQGTIWAYETAVVSVGATRRFAFREIESNEKETGKPKKTRPHVFVLMHGDVTEMFNDCQSRFQHTVKTAEGKEEMAPRASLVFKRTYEDEDDDTNTNDS